MLENHRRAASNQAHNKTMKTLTLILFVGLIFSLFALAADAPKEAKLCHVVAFKFKETATKEEIKEVEDAFRALKGKIPQIVSYEWGTNISPEKLNKGFTHGFILTFKNVEDRDAYLVHPEHKKFGELVGAVLADVFVIDFQAKD